MRTRIINEINKEGLKAIDFALKKMDKRKKKKVWKSNEEILELVKTKKPD